MRTSLVARTLIVAVCVLAGALVAPAPAKAAATVTVPLDCASDVGFSAAPGDTIVFTFGAGCNYSQVRSANSMWNLWNVNRGYQTNTASGFLTYVSRSVYTTTDTSAGFEQYAPNANYPGDWFVAAPTGMTGSVTTTLRSTDGAGNALVPGSVVAVVNNEYWIGGVSVVRAFGVSWLGMQASASADGPSVVVPMQSFVIGSGEDCSRVAPAWVNWPGLEGQQGAGWSRSWQQWPNAGQGGHVCFRQPLFAGSRGWYLP